MNDQQTVPVSPAPDAAPSVPVQDAPANPGAAAPVPDNAAPPVQSAVNAAPAAVEPDYRAMYENVRRENEILRHNAQIAQSSPVQGVTGGGAVAEPVDDFIRGFDSDTW